MHKDGCGIDSPQSSFWASPSELSAIQQELFGDTNHRGMKAYWKLLTSTKANFSVETFPQSL